MTRLHHANVCIIFEDIGVGEGERIQKNVATFAITELLSTTYNTGYRIDTQDEKQRRTRANERSR